MSRGDAWGRISRNPIYLRDRKRKEGGGEDLDDETRVVAYREPERSLGPGRPETPKCSDLSYKEKTNQRREGGCADGETHVVACRGRGMWGGQAASPLFPKER